MLVAGQPVDALHRKALHPDGLAEPLVGGVIDDRLDRRDALAVAGGRLGARIERFGGLADHRRSDAREQRFAEVIERGEDEAETQKGSR